MLRGMNWSGRVSIGDGKECKLWLGSRGKLVIVGHVVVKRLAFLNVLVMDRSERWNLDVAGSAYGGRDFGPCSYPRGWTLNKLKSNLLVTWAAAGTLGNTIHTINNLKNKLEAGSPPPCPLHHYFRGMWS